MRKIIVTEFMTLDGVIEAPHEWSFPYWNDAIGKYKFDELFATDALLLGRVTYEGFAAAWPSRTDEAGFADRFNSMPKYVVSTTLRQAAWNNSTIISTNVTEELAKRKQEQGKDIFIHGSCRLVNSLLPLGLIDEVRLLVYPLVRGRGLRLFSDGSMANLTLAETQSFASGVVALHYQVAGPEKMA